MNRRQLIKSKKINDKRESILIVGIGQKGIGKTYRSYKELMFAVKGDKKRGIEPRKALIFDVTNEFRKVKSIALADIKKWADVGKIEMRRVQIFKAKKDMDLMWNGKKVYNTSNPKMTLNEMTNVLNYILDNYHDGILLVEDINKYISDTLPSDLLGAIVTQRHLGVDIILHFQVIEKYGHPKIIGNTNIVRIHKYFGSVMRHESKFGDRTIPLLICEEIIKNRYNNAVTKEEKSFYVYYDTDKDKIIGKFSKEEFNKALENVLEKYYNKLVKPIINSIDLKTGEKKYKDRNDAIEKIMKEYTENYYGN